MRDLIAFDDLTTDEVVQILERSAELRAGAKPISAPFTTLLGFFEASTRTRIGFVVATARLGGVPVDLDECRYGAGMSTAESLEDTIRCASGLVDVAVLRHASSTDHRRAVAAATCPVINAGNGAEEHPTQALIDLFAVRHGIARLEGLRIGLIGDLGSRCAHSFVRAMGRFSPAELRLMHPEGRRLDDSWLEGLDRHKIEVVSKLRLDGLDIAYFAGLPEHGPDGRLGVAERKEWRLTPELLRSLPESGLVLCPLPRIDEIDPRVDEEPRCVYFQQSDNGLFVRMALLERLLA